MAAVANNPTMRSNSTSGDEDRKIFLGGLSNDTQENDLKEYFGKYGEIEKATVKFDSMGRPRGFGFVTFINIDSVDSVLNEGTHFIKNKHVEPKRPKGKQAMKKIFCGGIDGDLALDEIKNYFSKFGNIENIERPFDRQRNRSRDFCFIIFETEEAAEQAVAAPKQVIGGKECDVKFSHPQSRNQNQNGYQNGFGRRQGQHNGNFMGGNRMNGGGRPQNGGNNWRGDRSGGNANFHFGNRGMRNDDRAFMDSQFLTNVDTMPPPSSGYGFNYKAGGYNGNPNFGAPNNYWN